MAFPAISCGVYGYPIAEAAHIALTTTVAFLREHQEVERVIFVLFAEETCSTFMRVRDALCEGV